MNNHEEDAHQALVEAIGNGGKLRMTIPANPATDTDLRIARALTELRDMTALLAKVKLALSGPGVETTPTDTMRVVTARAIIDNYEEMHK